MNTTNQKPNSQDGNLSAYLPNSLIPTTKTTRNETCATHGNFVSSHRLGIVWSKCPACNKEAKDNDATEKKTEERRKRLVDWQHRIDSAGIPDRFQDRSLDSFVAKTDEQRKALAFAIDYADGFDHVIKTGRSALFLGSVGTGKTHLACGIGLRLMSRQNRTVLFTRVMPAIRRITATWNHGGAETTTQAIAALVFPELLILDEVGVQFGSETEKTLLTDVLITRHEKRRPTLLLSNNSLDEVRAYLGERVFDRLREDGGEVVIFNWPSHRGQADATGHLHRSGRDGYDMA